MSRQPAVRIADCDHKLAQYRRLVEAGADPADIVAWINETKARRVRAEQDLAVAGPHADLTTDEIEGMLADVPDKVAMLTQADPATNQRLYAELGLTLTYQPDDHLVRVEARPAWESVRVGGASSTRSTRGPWRSVISPGRPPSTPAGAFPACRRGDRLCAVGGALYDGGGEFSEVRGFRN